MVLFFLFATPFCYAVLGTLSGRRIPCSSQYLLNSLEVNSTPLSVLKALISYPVPFSTNALNFLKVSKASDLFLKKYTHLILTPRAHVTFLLHLRMLFPIEQPRY